MRSAASVGAAAERQASRASPERRLALLLCGTRSSRAARTEEAVRLVRLADAQRLGGIMERLHLFVLLGQRLMALEVGLDPRLEEEIVIRTDAARKGARLHELLTLAILDRLEQAQIRALGLKGSLLARELYGDAASRSSGDIDILVAPAQLRAAIEVVQRMGWTWNHPISRADRLPILHETLAQPPLPAVELHWRIHWYETRFSADVLNRAERPEPRRPLRMQPGDGLAALTLFYARDGFAGLRLAADVAAWWDVMCSGANADLLISSVAGSYPELAASLWVGTGLLGPTVNLPTEARCSNLRWRAAAELATPFYDGGRAQVNANTSLVDLLLAPPRSGGDSLRREARKIPDGIERSLTKEDELAHHLARWGHVLRVACRWAVALCPALARACRTRRRRLP